jgi:Domain of unknown function (DUF4174)
MKLSILTALLTTVTLTAETLEDFRWKHRLLVVTGDKVVAREKLTAAEPGLKERDVRVFFLEAPDMNEALANQLRKRLKVRPGMAEILLLGKDGHTTLRWKTAEFSVESLFSKIDAMPMRKSEMRGD